MLLSTWLMAPAGRWMTCCCHSLIISSGRCIDVIMSWQHCQTSVQTHVSDTCAYFARRCDHDRRTQGGSAAQPLAHAAAAQRQRFSPFKRSMRAGQPRPGSARAVLSSAAAAAPGSSTLLLPLHEGISLGGSPGQRSDVPMQRLLGGKARLRPQVPL